MRGIQTLLLAALVLAMAALSAAPATAAGVLTSCAAADHPLNDPEELAFLDIINGYRVEHGLRELMISTNLNREALWMARDMATNHYFGHYDSLGRHPWVRSVDCGYPIPAGENLAAGWKQGGAQAAFDLFRGSPTHNENMLQPDYRQVGIARYWDEDSVYGWYWATEFGTTDDGTSPRVAFPAIHIDPIPGDRLMRTMRVPPAAPTPEPTVCSAGLGDASVEGTLYQLRDDGSWRHFSAGLPDFANTFDPSSAREGPCWLVGPVAGGP